MDCTSGVAISPNGCNTLSDLAVYLRKLGSADLCLNKVLKLYTDGLEFLCPMVSKRHLSLGDRELTDLVVTDRIILCYPVDGR